MPISEIDELADAHLAHMAHLDPCAASRMSIGGSETELTDYSPAGVEARADRLRQTKSALAELDPTNGDTVTAHLLGERVGALLDQYEAGDFLGLLGTINGPVSAIRSAFDNMPKATDEDWDVVGSRLSKVPGAVASIRDGVTATIAASHSPVHRQVLATIKQCETWSGAPGTGGWFASLAESRVELEPLAVAAGEALRELGDWLQAEVVPVANPVDAVGEEKYRRAARMMQGTDLDPREAYGWAWDELHRLEAEARATIDAIVPGASFVEAKAHLDDLTAIEGVGPWLAWLQSLTDTTTEQIQGTYFDIDPALIACEAMLPPAGVAAAPYYTPPSEDLRVPGRTWYPTLGRERLPTWEMTTTVFHEAVPGHHLQIGRVKVLAGLCRYRRNTFVSAHGEGWALYAERLMDELGAYADDPGGRLGFLSFQMLRAARVVIDIGLHLGYSIPDDEQHGGQAWSPEIARAMMVERCGLTEAFAASEVDRYLGWPAQAIGYKLGEREWLAAREEARAAQGATFDLKAWHSKALDLGSLGLTQMRDELNRP
ncbi:MAG: hypothetical protein QOF97_1253 [Acidimicrobiaceae bacterium]